MKKRARSFHNCFIEIHYQYFTHLVAYQREVFDKAYGCINKGVLNKMEINKPVLIPL